MLLEKKKKKVRSRFLTRACGSGRGTPIHTLPTNKQTNKKLKEKQTNKHTNKQINKLTTNQTNNIKQTEDAAVG